MKRLSLFAILSVVAGVVLSVPVLGQTDVADKFLISAKPGGVNQLEGNVTVIRQDGTGGQLLRRDRIDVGDRVTTGANGLAEILLNPGSFIRLASNSSFEFGTTDLEDLQLRLDSGTAIFEVFADDEFRVTVTTPKGRLALIETGIYRVDIAADGNALLSVTKGKAEIAGNDITVVKEGRTGTINGSTVAVKKFDKKKLDTFAKWSKERSKEIAEVSSSLQARTYNGAIASGFRNGLWSVYGSFGLWVFDARFGGYCFLPFGHGWRSPYGYWYYNGIYWQYYPNYVPTRDPVNPNNPPTPPRNPRNPAETIGRDPNPGTIERSPRVRVEAIERTPPPFTRVDRGSDRGGNTGYSNPRINDPIIDRSGSSFPTYTPPPVVSAPPPVSVPPSHRSKDN